MVFLAEWNGPMPKKVRAPDPTDVHVGSRVRTRRQMLGMSQSKLAEALGVSFQQLQKYENGKNRMGSSRLQQAAQALDVSIGYFFEGAPGGSKKPRKVLDDYTKQFFKMPESLPLARAFMQISNRQVRSQLANLVELLAESK
jgi:transcriptional regulator with XRE-family HTH domain